MAGGGKAVRVAMGTLCLVVACSTSDRPSVVRNPDDAGSAGGTGGTGGNGGTAGDGGGGDAGSSMPPADAGSDPVLLGLTPPTAVGVKETPADAQQAFANHLESVALGSRGVSIRRRWSDLFVTEDQEVSEAWTRLGQIASLYGGAGRSLLLTLAVVDRSDDARPVLLGGSWDSTVMLAAGERLVDHVYATFGSELAYLVIGHEVEHYLREPGASGFVTFAEHVVQYARTAPARPEGIRVGIGIGLRALAEREPSSVVALASMGDALFASYYPRADTWEAKSPTAVAGDLDDALAAWRVDGGDAPPIVLSEVGYPSDLAAGSTNELQRAFFDNLFVALSSRRSSFPFISIVATAELDGEHCAREADTYPDSVPRGRAYFCSIGLREGAGPKPAFERVVSALTEFSDP